MLSHTPKVKSASVA